MSKFAMKAKELTVGSFVTVGKEKVEIDEVMRIFPNGVTVTSFDFLTGSDGDFAVCGFAEDESVFFFGGKILTGMCKAWAEGYASTKEASADLASEGGVKLRFKRSKTKANRDVTLVEVVE